MSEQKGANDSVIDENFVESMLIVSVSKTTGMTAVLTQTSCYCED